MSVEELQCVKCDRCSSRSQPVERDEFSERTVRRHAESTGGFIQMEYPAGVRIDLCKRCAAEVQAVLQGAVT